MESLRTYFSHSIKVTTMIKHIQYTREIYPFCDILRIEALGYSHTYICVSIQPFMLKHALSHKHCVSTYSIRFLVMSRE